MRRGVLVLLALLSAGLGVARAQVNMPDPSMINGRALPGPELPDGTVSVRTVRESVGNNITGQTVTVTVGSVTKQAKTDDQGRALFTGLPSSGEATAKAEVDGESLVSQPFTVPSRGGIRVILVAGIQQAAERRAKEAAEAAAAPPIKGTVVLGGDSRVMMEFRDDELRVFYMLDIVNTARGRVDIGGPLVIQLPKDAEQATVLEGSATTASVKNNRLTVVGPFKAGTTTVQVAYALPSSRATRVVEQVWPVRLEQVLVMIQKVPGLQVSSPQLVEKDEARAQNGTPFILGGGPGIAAGGALAVTLTGLPVHPAWPRYVALTLAALILLVGAWYTWTGGREGATDLKRLVERKDGLLTELARLDDQHRAGKVDGSKYAARRHKLVADLERVYGEIDGVGGQPGGGEAVA